MVLSPFWQPAPPSNQVVQQHVGRRQVSRVISLEDAVESHACFGLKPACLSLLQRDTANHLGALQAWQRLAGSPNHALVHTLLNELKT
jgi:hypothetical protein